MRFESRTDTRGVLTYEQVEILIVSFIRDRDVYDAVSDSIEPEHFNIYTELHLKFIMEVLRRVYSEYTRSLNQAEFVALAHSQLSNHSYMDERATENFWNTLGYAYELDICDLPGHDIVEKLVLEFVEEREVVRLKQNLETPDRVPANITGLLDRVNDKITNISVANNAVVSNLFDDNWRETLDTKRTPFGVNFIDRYMDGGGASGEVYGFLGPFGSCKTLLAVQLSTSMAMQNSAFWVRHRSTESLGLVYYVPYEEPISSVLVRAMACNSRVSTNVLKRPGIALSTMDSLSEEDRDRFRDEINQGIKFLPEQTRCDITKRILGLNWRVIDFTPESKKAGVPSRYGTNVFTEVRRAIDADLKMMRRNGIKCHCAGIFVDYLKIIVKRHMALSNQKDQEIFRRLLEEAPMHAKSFLAVEFGVPVFLFQQLSGEGNKLAPGICASYLQAAGCASFGEHMDFVFVVSNKSKDGTDLCTLSCQKHRHYGTLAPSVIKVDGAYACAYDVSDRYSYDDKRKIFVEAGSMQATLDYEPRTYSSDDDF